MPGHHPPHLPSTRARQAAAAARGHLLSLLVATALGCWAALRHLAWMRADHGLPIGDAPGHVMIAVRWWRALNFPAELIPNDPFPPVVYLTLAWAQQHLGHSFDALSVPMAAWVGLLVAGAAWAASRGGGGPAAALLAGLVVLRAPLVAQISRQFLLDGPALAAVCLTLGAAWWSKGFARPLPAALTGLALGLVILTKYSLLIWLLGPVLVWLIVLIFRTPASLLPLTLAGLILSQWMRLIWSLHGVRSPEVSLPWPQLAELGATAGGWLVIGSLIPTRRRGRWSTSFLSGLRRGCFAAGSVWVALAVSLTWLWWGTGAVWEKVSREALQHVRSAGWTAALDYAQRALGDSIPLAGWAAVAAVLVLVLGFISRGRNATAAAASHFIEVCSALALGTWMLSRTLPLDPKYYLPVGPLAAIGLAVALGGHRLGRRLILPAASLAILGLLVLDPTDPTALPPPNGGRNVLALSATNPWRLPKSWTRAPTPQEDPWDVACKQITTSFTAAWPTSPRGLGCQGLTLDIPPLLVIEDRSIMAQAALLGFGDEMWMLAPGDLPTCAGISLISTRLPPEATGRGPEKDSTRLPNGARTLDQAQPTPWARLVGWTREVP